MKDLIPKKKKNNERVTERSMTLPKKPLNNLIQILSGLSFVIATDNELSF